MLLVGLGNPGKKYEGTRHNLGFQAVREFVKTKRLELKKDSSMDGEFAKAVIGEKELLVLLPTTYMNASGVAVKECVGRYPMFPYDMLVICDDAALPLGTLRLRAQGSSGGHNGLKSIEECLGTQCYPRLRMGIGMPLGTESLEEFVLRDFNDEEKPQVLLMIEKAQKFIETWLLEGIGPAMQLVNQKEK